MKKSEAIEIVAQQFYAEAIEEGAAQWWDAPKWGLDAETWIRVLENGPNVYFPQIGELTEAFKKLGSTEY